MKYEHYHRVSSTNDIAKELLKNESIVFVTADYQTEGRGRHNRHWEGNIRENLFCSAGIKHNIPIPYEQAALYQAIGCLAAKKALKEVTGCDLFKIKYPNDILARTGKEMKKISGVLVENGFTGAMCNYSVIGIGINVNQTKFSKDLEDKATSLSLLDFRVEPAALLTKLTDFLKQLLNEDLNHIFELWKKELNIMGKVIEVTGRKNKLIVQSVNRDLTLNMFDETTNEEIIINDGDSIKYNL